LPPTNEQSCKRTCPASFVRRRPGVAIGCAVVPVASIPERSTRFVPARFFTSIVPVIVTSLPGAITDNDLSSIVNAA
jgi:hypothetical protein